MVFQPSVITRVFFSYKVPVELDISFPLKFNLLFTCNDASAGNIEWVYKYTYTNGPPSVIFENLTEPQNTTTGTKITNIPAGSNNKNISDSFNVNCSHIIPNTSSLDGYYIYGTLERVGISSNDNYPGNIILIAIDYNYVCWVNGGRLSNF